MKFEKEFDEFMEASVPFIEEHIRFEGEFSDEDIQDMQQVEMLPDRRVQDYKSTYNDIRDWLRKEKESTAAEKSKSCF